MNSLKRVCLKCIWNRTYKSVCIHKRDGLYSASCCFLELSNPLDYSAACDLFSKDQLRRLDHSRLNSIFIPNDSPIFDWFFKQDLTCFGDCHYLVEIGVLGNVNYNPFRVPFSWR